MQIRAMTAARCDVSVRNGRSQVIVQSFGTSVNTTRLLKFVRIFQSNVSNILKLSEDTSRVIFTTKRIISNGWKVIQMLIQENIPASRGGLNYSLILTESHTPKLL